MCKQNEKNTNDILLKNWNFYQNNINLRKISEESLNNVTITTNDTILVWSKLRGLLFVAALNKITINYKRNNFTGESYRARVIFIFIEN